ncbi:MAG: ribosome silencing factor [Opitutaceae bacterium]|nr:ribosome silencing factor [Opitutaceae bacterium]
MKAKKTATLELIRNCCRALDDKKAEDLRVLDVSEQSSVTDYMVMGTATSEPHLRALRVEIEKVLDAADAVIVGMDAAQFSGWMVIDAFDVMFHMFLPEHRQTYALENLWKDGKQLSVTTMLAPPKKVVKKRAAAPAKKKAVSKKKTTAVKKKAAPAKKKTTPAKKKVALKKKTSTKK